MMTWDEQLQKFRSRHRRLTEQEGMTLIAEAYRDLASEYRYNFLIGEAQIQTEAAFQPNGTVAITNGSTALTLTPGTDGLTFNTGWTYRRALIGTQGEVYRVLSFGSTTTATLASPWAGADLAAGTLTMFRSEYSMPADCDYGMDLVFLDVAQMQPLAIYSSFEVHTAQAYVLGQVGTPEALCRSRIDQDVSGNPLEVIEFGPAAPSAAGVYVAFYSKKPAAITDGTKKPLWPENFEDLIWRRAEINLEQNPSHRVMLDESLKQVYRSRLLNLRKRSDGGAEVEHRIQLYRGSRRFPFQNIHFTPSGINPLVGG
jgi:hypothetical protein